MGYYHIFFFFCILSILPESPRWLIAKNRKQEAFEVLKHVAKVNKRHLNEQTWAGFLESEKEIIKPKEETLISVLKSTPMLILLFILVIHWIVNNFVFYGLGLKSTELGANPYLTFSISALVELFGIIGATILVDKLGRKWCYGVSLIIAGAACIAILFIDDKRTILIVIFAMMGKFFVASSYAIIYLFSSELFPTSVRNSCIGLCSMMARVGSMTAPLINALVRFY
jgi:Na+/melibiose symporter-like transporter